VIETHSNKHFKKKLQMQLKNFLTPESQIFVLCLNFKAVPVPNMTAYGEKEASHHSFLILALERGVWLPSCLTTFPWGEKTPHSH
jgi:hypothetical protein